MSLADAPCVVLGKFSQEIQSPTKISSNDSLSYKIEAPMPKMLQGSYSVSAYVNMGWIPNPNSNEWIRVGDLLTDTMYEVQLQKGVDRYTMDIPMVKY